MSMDLSTTQLATAIRECDKAVTLIQKPQHNDTLTLDAVLNIKEKLLKLEEEFVKCGESAAKKSGDSDEPEGTNVIINFFKI